VTGGVFVRLPRPAQVPNPGQRQRRSTIIVWDVASGKKLQTLKGHAAGANHVGFTADGKAVASASEDATVKL